MKDITTNQLVQIPEITANEVISAIQVESGLISLINEKFSPMQARVYDMEDPKQVEQCRSDAYALSRTKKAIEKTVDEFTKERRDALKIITSQKTAVMAAFDEIRTAVRAPLTALEKAEEARKAAIKARMDVFAEVKEAENLGNYGSKQLNEKLAEIKAIPVDVETFTEEFLSEAKLNKFEAIELIEIALEEAVKIERVQAEQAAQAEAARLEREEQIRKDAAQQAERQAAERIRQAEERAKAAEERAKQAQQAPIEAVTGDCVAGGTLPRNQAMVSAAAYLQEKIAESGMLDYDQAEELAKTLVKSIYKDNSTFLKLIYK